MRAGARADGRPRRRGAAWRRPRLLPGLFLTALLAAAGRMLGELPGLGVLGPLVLAILLGMAYREWLGGVPDDAAAGIAFSSKQLLRLGIVLLGMRLNLGDIAAAGPGVLAIDAIHIAVTIPLVCWLAGKLGADRRLGLLTACGTAICGAAAVAAIAPQLKAKGEETAVAAATVAILGTIFTIAYTLLQPLLPLGSAAYGAWAGSTLHEVAHALAAAEPYGEEALDMAVLVKLTRVAMLVPAALLIGLWTQRRKLRRSGEQQAAAAGREGGGQRVQVPWFIFGFLATSGIHTLGFVPEEAAQALVTAAYLLIAMGMAGLGLGVDFATFRRLGGRVFAAGFGGSLLLSALGYGLVRLFGLGG
ncbi:putative sulfate exporter family transporter [Paenibacillus albicereus]|uniref:Putative sulfate exporter family transporter n=1 Tax=Paenibacillus albicereus TaxID=2726185 RepID=A0A6H2H4T7_9BACL|nr:putative sulfate exporter family transporter [Paenibacillus albicereus]QJC54358.1 putative sulfate exporter family transporter [Paenibacillus albicereus]